MDPHLRNPLGTSRTAPLVVRFGISAKQRRGPPPPRELRGSLLRLFCVRAVQARNARIDLHVRQFKLRTLFTWSQR
eukprot:9493907-Alexandrium_andersonii.AAC.1